MDPGMALGMVCAATAQTMDICMTFTGNMGGAMDINIGLVSSLDLDMALGGSTDLDILASGDSAGHQHPVPGAAQPTDNMASGCGSDHELPHSIQQ